MSTITTALTMQDMVRRIQEHVEIYERTSLGFDTCAAYYNDEMGQWILIWTEETPRRASHWADLESILQQVPLDEIDEWYALWASSDYHDE